MKLLPVAALLPLLLIVGACADYPRDTAETLDRARREGFRVGWVRGGERDPALLALVGKLASETGGRAKASVGGAEALLLQVEHGQLDLVVGEFDTKSPWDKRVTFSNPVSTRATSGGAVEAKAALRNGEHAWAMAVDRAVGELSPSP